MKHFYLIGLFLLFAFTSFSQKGVPASPAQDKTAVKFFPNPASTFITFELPSAPEKGAKLYVYSFLGRQVMTASVTTARVSINVSELMKGIYVFQLKDASGRVLATNKFQVSR